MTEVFQDGEASLYAALARHHGDRRPFGRLTAICHASLEVLGVTGVGVMLMARRAHQGTAYATDDTIRALEDRQNDAAEGPCLDAYNLGRPVLEPDLAGAGMRPWPLLAPTALAAGMRAAFAFPLRLDDTSVGRCTCTATGPVAVAATRLRDHARARGRSVAAVATDVVARTLRIEPPDPA